MQIINSYTDAHLDVNEWNTRRLMPSLPNRDWREEIHEEYQNRIREGELVERWRKNVCAEAQRAPSEPEAFVAWFEALKTHGPGQGDTLFPWLATTANLSQLKWFLTQEVSGEAGFDDLVALTQVRFEGRAKLELARNYWDEMGRGTQKGMHGPMLTRLARELNLPTDREPVFEAIALSNLMIAFASNRRYAYHSIGALGVIELTAPERCMYINQSLKRLGVKGHARMYYALHSTLDIAHSKGWNSEVLLPLLEEHPACGVAIAEGALMRLSAGQRCFERYRRELGISRPDNRELQLQTCSDAA